MKPINNNLVMQRLSAYALNEVQKSLGIANTVRLKADPDNHRLWLRSGDGMKVLPYGEQSEGRTVPPIEIDYDYEREVASIWVDDITTLVCQNRQLDFDPLDIGQEYGELNLEVQLNAGFERIPIWESLPARPQETVHNHRPRVVGLMT